MSDYVLQANRPNKTVKVFRKDRPSIDKDEPGQRVSSFDNSRVIEGDSKTIIVNFDAGDAPNEDEVYMSFPWNDAVVVYENQA